MKIGFFTDTYFPQINGVTYTLHLWKRGLEKLGHEVFIYYPKSEEYEPEENEIPLKSMPFIFYKGYKIGLPSARRVNKDLDLFHIHGLLSTAAFGVALARNRKVPCVLTYHTPPDQYLRHVSPSQYMQAAIKTIYFLYEKELLERCQVITMPSETIREVLHERLGPHLNKTVVLSNGIDTDLFKEVSTEKFREDYKIPEGKVIGFAGRHCYEKHPEDLIGIADDFDGTILFIGGGPQEGRYKKMAKGKANVRFLGFLPRERLPEYYSLLDCLVLPSTAETEGIVVPEANACGTPVVGANALALKDTIDGGVNGFLYEPGDLEGLKRGIDMVFSNKVKLCKSSKEHAKKHSTGKTIEKLVGIYENLEDEGLSVS
jgi:glycosyltransferase involved in cell wall biosynthesis